MKEANAILDITVVSTITGRKLPSNINLFKKIIRIPQSDGSHSETGFFSMEKYYRKSKLLSFKSEDIYYRKTLYPV
jgi:hypothetical protein